MRPLISLIVILALACSSINIDTYREIGIRQYENDSTDEAIETFTTVINKTDSCSECFLYRGFAYKDKRLYEKAKFDFSKYVELNPNSDIGYANRASVFYLEMDYENSLTDFLKAYYLDTTQIRYFNPISHMLFATGQQERACEFYNRAIAVGDTTFDKQITDYCNSR